MKTDNETGAERLLTRRALVKTGGTAAVALAVPGTALARSRSKRLRSHLRRSSYHSLVGQRFRVTGTGLRLRLVAVEDLTRHQAHSENAFALIFRAPRGAHYLSQQVPELHHPALGSFKLLVSAGERSRTNQRYVAVINRLHG
jgi:hypothetical protein